MVIYWLLGHYFINHCTILWLRSCFLDNADAISPRMTNQCMEPLARQLWFCQRKNHLVSEQRPGLVVGPQLGTISKNVYMSFKATIRRHTLCSVFVQNDSHNCTRVIWPRGKDRPTVFSVPQGEMTEKGLVWSGNCEICTCKPLT